MCAIPGGTPPTLASSTARQHQYFTGKRRAIFEYPVGYSDGDNQWFAFPTQTLHFQLKCGRIKGTAWQFVGHCGGTLVTQIQDTHSHEETLGSSKHSPFHKTIRLSWGCCGRKEKRSPHSLIRWYLMMSFIQSWREKYITKCVGSPKRKSKGIPYTQSVTQTSYISYDHSCGVASSHFLLYILCLHNTFNRHVMSGPYS